MRTKSRIGFISTRLAGTDGVSLETIKWSNILKVNMRIWFFTKNRERVTGGTMILNRVVIALIGCRFLTS